MIRNPRSFHDVTQCVLITKLCINGQNVQLFMAIAFSMHPLSSMEIYQFCENFDLNPWGYLSASKVAYQVTRLESWIIEIHSELGESWTILICFTFVKDINAFNAPTKLWFSYRVCFRSALYFGSYFSWCLSIYCLLHV